MARTIRSHATPGQLLFSPALDLGLQPELDATRPEIKHRARHIGVSVLIHADRIAVSEPEDFGYAVRVQKIIDVHLLTHEAQITFVSGSVRTES